MSNQTGTNNILPGTEIAGYRIERELGRGAMAVVYRAIQLNLQRAVALKVLSPELASSREFVERFFNEARAAAALSHANIIQAYDAGVADNGIYYFAMEYVEGETVQDRIRRDGAIPVRTALRMATDIADALDYGWQRQKLTHGDIKPENIMVNTEGETKLADFGLAKVAEHDFAGSDVMLTPLYASPEAIRGELPKGDCRGDIYSFGATLYHMIAGHPPFPGHGTEEVLERHLNEKLTPLSAVAEDLPPGVSDFVGSLLEKSAAKRPQDWHSILLALRDLGKGKARAPVHKLRVGHGAGAVRSPVVVHQPQRKRSLLLPFMIVAALLTIAIGAFVVFRDVSAPPPPAPPAATTTVAVQPAVPAPQPATTVAEDQAKAEAQQRVEKLWEELQARLKAFDGEPETCIGALETFEAEHRAVWLPPDFAVRLRDYRQAAEIRAATVTPVPQPPPPVEDVVPEPPPEVAPPASASARNLGQSRDVLRQDAFAVLCGQFRAFPYRPGTSVERLQQVAKAWLAEFPEESDQKTQATLLAEVLLPALDECIPKLVANQADLLGKALVLDKRTQGVIQELTLDYLALDEKTPHGSLRRRIVWSDLRDCRPLLALYQLSLTPEVSLRERRTCLALAMLARDDSVWRAATAGLTPSVELSQWQTLYQSYLAAEREGPAAEFWSQLAKLFASGQEDAKAYRMARELMGTRTLVAERHQADLAAIETTCAESVPEIKAGRMVRDAQETMTISPLESLQTLNLVRVRYGALDFPERNQIDAIRGRILGKLERPWATTVGEGELPAPSIFYTTVTGRWGSPPHVAMLGYQDWANARDLPVPYQNLLPAVQMIALLELGDWAAAADVQARCNLSRSALPDSEFRGCAAFAVGLLAERFPRKSQAGVDALAVIRECATIVQARPPIVTDLAMLLADCALVTRRCSEPEGSILLTDAVDPAPQTSSKAAFLLSALAVQFEAGRQDKAAQWIADIANDPPRRRSYGLTSLSTQFLAEVADFATGKGSIDPQSLELPYANYERFLRLTVSALCLHPDQAGPLAERLASDADARLQDLGPLGGSALYDLLLLRVSLALQKGGLKEAQALVESALAATCTAWFPYYPRLLFLKAGLARVAGDTGKLDTIIDLVRDASVTNSGEYVLASLLDPGLDRTQIQFSKAQCRNLRFWGEWLEGTLRIAKGAPEQRAKIANSIFLDQCAPAERLLTPALAKYYLQ